MAIDLIKLKNAFDKLFNDNNEQDFKAWLKQKKMKEKLLPKDKAKELVANFNYMLMGADRKLKAKAFSLMVVSEILKSFEGFMDARRNFRHELEIDAERYWLSVKKEISKL